MTNSMASRFRVKKLSPKHPLPIYRESQLSGLMDPANMQRSVPQIETGVEKEEEEEHDLQAAISAAQAAVTTGAKVETYIPTPDASHTIDDSKYHVLYKRIFKEPSTFVRFSSVVEDTCGCPYVMDEDDEAFLKQLNSRLHTSLSEDDFEQIMWQFESIADKHYPHLDLDLSQIPPYQELVSYALEYSLLRKRSDTEPVYAHWKQRRQRREGKPVIPRLRFEDIIRNEIDPYVCFRRREARPVRKTRRTDQQSLERLRKLRTEMEMARNLLEMVLRREKIRKEDLVLEHTVFDKKCKFREYQRALGIKEEDDLLFVPKKKRRVMLDSGSSGTTIKIPLHRLKREDFQKKSQLQLVIDSDLARKRELDAPYEDITDSPYQPFSPSLPSRFYKKLSEGTRSHYRKRLGRCGRIFIDRVNSKPRSPGHKLSDRYQFDSDISSDEESNDCSVDEMQNRFLRHRVQLLSEVELRSLVTIPFLTPLSMMSSTIHAANQRVNTQQRISGIRTNGSQPQSPQLSPLPLKRQNSRLKLTPQQAAVAMTNDMIVANMAAVVSGATSQHRNAVQFAMAANQQQQLHTNGGTLLLQTS
ncbi:enhancer of polycomb-like-domain-containing protein [Radiomyces spectabilis]|uniref:enhancer of polycomb-like-domain-containing protein n=1 Tax=Radiomyces spectabilis TaxID=64574 RepID=UPI00221EDB1E|nr:enhancer of polycomb-like-domain-containing protein [Radiomyces spectabilis]KAI8393745.1 enhancer of polycomb-like-domain-containing protein [Radiomyces spectabilis]